MRNIPNILSGIRIALIPVFVWLMGSQRTLAAAVVLGVSGLTDILDGFLARRFNWISQLGKVLDPVADKLTQVTACVVMAIYMRRYWPFFAVLLLKEAVMLVLGGYILARGGKIDGAKWFGKAVTVLFYVSMAAVVCWPEMPAAAVYTLLGLTTGCALAAFFLYIPDFLRYLRGGESL